MTRYLAYLVVVGVGLAFQTTWLARATIAGAIPDPLLIFVLTIGLLHGPEEGALAGAGIGLLRDIVTGVPLGLGMLADMGVGFCAGLGQRFIYMESTWLPVIGGTLLGGLRAAVWALAAQLVGLLQGSLPEVARVVVAAACYNGIVAIPLFRAFRSLDRALVRLHEEAR
jgi:rod shape-determining protein MreD